MTGYAKGEKSGRITGTQYVIIIVYGGDALDGVGKIFNIPYGYMLE